MRFGRPSDAVPSTVALLAALAVTLAGCSLLTPFGLPPPSDDGGIDGGDGGRDAEGEVSQDAHVDGDVDVDVDGPPIPSGPGPITLLLREATLVVEPVCDVDGDGDPDNAVAALGREAAQQVGLFFDVATSGAIETGYRQLLHFPLVEAREGPSDARALLITFRGHDVDDPIFPHDDFDGAEPFYAMWEYVDACGEPRAHMPDASFDGGELQANGGSVFVFVGAPLYLEQAVVRGTVAPGGLEASLTICGAALIRSLGDTVMPVDGADQTVLEFLVSGGSAYGIPFRFGIDPDLDLDHDGVERIILDDSFHVAFCIDGDETVIAGRDCTQDPRIADGVSMAVSARLVSAAFAGREPGWEDRVEGHCDDPPERSLFDPL